MSLLASLRNFFLREGSDKTYWIAYSGGLDSHVLLALAVALRQEYSLKIKVVHINHGLSKHAVAWSQHCVAVCRQYQVELIEHALQLAILPGDSLEEEARDQRYAFLASCLQPGDILLTAHHQDDQAETLLIQLLRGAGPKGLAAMPEIKPFAGGYHARPLLAVSRAELMAYAEESKFHWIEDESNQDTRLTRNFMRHEVLPMLQKRWPGAAGAIARSAGHCAEMHSIIDDYSSVLLEEVTGSKDNLLSVKKLLQLDMAKQRLALRAWMMASGYELPDSRKIATIISDVLPASRDSMPCVAWRGVELRRYRDDLYLVKPIEQALLMQQYTWDMQTSLRLPGVGLLTAHAVNGMGLSATINQVTVSFREVEGNERHLHRLKNVYQDYGVPPWERSRVPLILLDGEIAGMVGYFTDKKYSARSGEHGRVIKISE